MKFVVEIDLGNDAVLTYGDVRDALARLVNAMRHTSPLVPRVADGGGDIADANGNRYVGRWIVKQ